MGRIDRLVQGTLRGNLNLNPVKGPRELAAPAARLAHTPGQRRHVQSEDHLLAKVAEAEGVVLLIRDDPDAGRRGLEELAEAFGISHGMSVPRRNILTR